jgi:hypothetical protein
MEFNPVMDIIPVVKKVSGVEFESGYGYVFGKGNKTG